MGNSSTKESRSEPRSLRQSGSSERGQSSSQAQNASDNRSRGRSGRNEFTGLLGIAAQATSGTSTSHERRETRQEREARRLERERQARLVERERSMREEHVDGGYLVTLGTYVGPEDFNKSIVRQLQIERRLAPFWRGLQDFSETWTEYQLVAAARGLEIPPPDQPPPEGFLPLPSSPHGSGNDSHRLTVPGDRTGIPSAVTPGPSAASASGQIPTGALAGTSSPSAPSPSTPNTSRSSSSPFKPRAKAFAAALSVSSRNGSTTDLTPREIVLPHDPFVNGQLIEVFLYKNAVECPICFITYPPYLNHTRCCDQPICSECFVQIKRADPHYPENHGDSHSDNHAENNELGSPEEQAGQLISEPACCPYCQQPEFGVTYDPPPFRRGLAHAASASVGSLLTAMSSSSTINSTAITSSLASPTSMRPPPTGGTTSPTARRRTQSLSTTAPNVVTTDRIRPDWSTKLATQRAHIARRAAAATALHTAAFLVGSEQRPFRVGRFSRWAAGGGNNVQEGNDSPGRSHSDGGNSGERSPSMMDPGPRSSSGRAVAGAASSSNSRVTRMEDLEELMFREALRQSLATEEERRRKEEKEARKEAKKREKEERKATKAALKQQQQQQHGSGSSVYGGGSGSGSGHSSASASSLSLPGIIGRRRGNSGASNLRVEASLAHAMAVSSGPGGAGSGSSGATSPAVGTVSNTTSGTASGSPGTSASDKGKSVDRGDEAAGDGVAAAATATATGSAGPRAIPSPQLSAGPSHLRQMSSASSMTSSQAESGAGSYEQSGVHAQDPRASGLSLGSRSAVSDEGPEHSDDRDASASSEPMFNFSSLAELVGVELEGRNAGRRLSAIQKDGQPAATGATAITEAAGESVKETEVEAAHGEHVEVAEGGRNNSHANNPPTVMVTPGTPAPPDGFQ